MASSSSSFGRGNSGFQAGIINGPANTTFHLHPKRPETPPSPSIVIPFSRDRNFIDRGDILDQVQRICSLPGSRAALVGLGGVGKSQLAIEYAYRIRETSPEIWVFWVHASNAARFEQGYREIAGRVKIPGRESSDTNVIRVVYDWLHNSKKRWILILDNLDDASFLLNPPKSSEDHPTNSMVLTQPLRAYLPHCQNGSILVTTRNQQAAFTLVDQDDTIAVNPMVASDACALFQKRLPVQGSDEDVAKLVSALEFMPLAISQAAAYISQRSPRCSVRQYLDKFRKNDRQKTSLLNHNEGQLRRDWEARNSIITTWEISFDYLRETRSSAADLLSLMSFCDRQGIPESLLRRRTQQENVLNHQTDHEDHGQDRADDDVVSGQCREIDAEPDDESASQSDSEDEEFEDDLIALRNFSFISTNSDGKTFEMHALVQLATRKWLQVHGDLQRCSNTFIRNLKEIFPTSSRPENWKICQVLFPHAKSAAELKPKQYNALLNWTAVLHPAACYACRMENGPTAEKLAAPVVKLCTEIFGQKHEKSLDAMFVLAWSYNIQGRHELAVKLEEQVLEARREELGATHRYTLSSMANLASTYSNLDRLSEAEELQVQVLESRKKEYGPSHPRTIKIMNNLASTYMNQGRLSEAGELQLQVVEASMKDVEANHPDNLTYMNNLAITWKEQGQMTKAIPLMRECVQLRQRILGADHHHTAWSLKWLERWERIYASTRALDETKEADDNSKLD